VVEIRKMLSALRRSVVAAAARDKQRHSPELAVRNSDAGLRSNAPAMKACGPGQFEREGG
jgi:hypothetical protein